MPALETEGRDSAKLECSVVALRNGIRRGPGREATSSLCTGIQGPKGPSGHESSRGHGATDQPVSLHPGPVPLHPGPVPLQPWVLALASV